MPHSIVDRLRLLLRSAARTLGGALVRWSGEEQEGIGDADGQQQAGSETNGAADKTPESTGTEEPEQSSRSPAELVSTAVSLLLIGLLAGAILYDGYARGEPVPASIEVLVDVDGTRREGDSFYVPFEAHNAGDQTVEQVLVTFEVYDGEELVEETDTVIPLLGERGNVTGVLVLDEDPAGLEIESSVSTFQSAEE